MTSKTETTNPVFTNFKVLQSVRLSKNTTWTVNKTVFPIDGSQ